MNELDAKFVRRAIELAMVGRGRVEPNPMVGCVLVRDRKVIGEGFHGVVGGPHAEPTAIADCRGRGNSPEGATAYVTLEPCCHLDKRTPPCVPALLSAGVRRVVLGCLDPNPKVNGEGVRQLREAGVEVVTGVLEKECQQMLAPFMARTLWGRPYVTVKWAESADGFMAGPNGEPRQITEPESVEIVHLLRARCDAILVGGETLRRDNPLLTARPKAERAGERRKLLRCVVTAGGAVPAGSRLFLSQEGGGVVVYLLGCGVVSLPGHVEVVRVGSMSEVMADLGRRGVAHLLVESGGRLANVLAGERLVDRAWRFQSGRPLLDVMMGEVDGVEGVRATAFGLCSMWNQTGEISISLENVSEYLNPDSDVYFAEEKSADFLQLVEGHALKPQTNADERR